MQNVIFKNITNGLYVLASRSGDVTNGMAATWVTQVSLDPLLLMVAIDPTRYTYGIVEKSGYFAVSTLPEGSEDLVKHFGSKSGRDEDKLAKVPCSNAPNGSPILDNALAYVECKVISTAPAGDHTLFVGEVVAAKVLNEGPAPLICNWAEYF